jgi:hypothetical protein
MPKAKEAPAPVQKSAPAPVTAEEDDDLSFFEKLANEE